MNLAGAVLILLAAQRPVHRPPDVGVRIHARPEAVERVFAAAQASYSALALELGELRSEAIPAAFSALVRAGCGPAPEPREALLAALGRSPRTELWRFFDGLCAAGAGPEERCSILDVVGDSGGVGDLASLASWVAEPAGTEESFARCVAALLAKDARGYAYLDDLLKRVPLALRPALVRGVAAARSELGMRALAAWAESERDLSLLAIVHIGRMARGMPRPIDDGVRCTVRQFLAERDAEARPEAALAAGEIDDDDAIPLLIDLLEDPSRALRANALWSLQRLSGLKMREQPDRWRAWYAIEQAWWRDDSARVLADLRSGSVKAVHGALESLAGIRTGRERLAAEVAGRLVSKNPTTVVQACVVLGRLGCTSAVPRLVDILADEDPAVRTAAREALKTIEGTEPPEASRGAPDPR